MTFSIFGHCPETGQIGLALTSVTMGVGATSPFYGYGGDIVVVQAKGNPQSAVAGAQTLDNGASAEEAIAAIIASDIDVEQRQLAILRRDGQMAGRTGAKNHPWAGEKMGQNCMAFGNVLSGPHVVDAMVAGYEKAAGDGAELASRLLSALEAGRDAGGQSPEPGRHYSERGAAIRIIGTEALPNIPAMDLRIDMEFDAVGALRTLYERYRPMVTLRALRAATPDKMPVLWEWEAENMSANPPPAIFYED
jgi:uncharacterized Ntn-hydrolase superfamily protein